MTSIPELTVNKSPFYKEEVHCVFICEGHAEMVKGRVAGGGVTPSFQSCKVGFEG